MSSEEVEPYSNPELLHSLAAQLRSLAPKVLSFGEAELIASKLDKRARDIKSAARVRDQPVKPKKRRSKRRRRIDRQNKKVNMRASERIAEMSLSDVSNLVQVDWKILSAEFSCKTRRDAERVRELLRRKLGSGAEESS